MLLIEWYKRHFRRKMFNKLLIIYSVITILSLTALSIVAYHYVSDNGVQKELYVSQQVLERVRSYIDEKYLYSMQTSQQLYTDQAMLEDVLYFLKHDISDYSRYRLDAYTRSSGFIARNMNVFFRFRLESDSDVDSMMLYSPHQRFVFTFKPYDNQRYTELPGDTADPLQIGASYGAPKFIRMTPPASLEGITSDHPVFSTQSAINDPYTLQNIGSLIINYDANGIERILQQQQGQLKGYVVVMSRDGEVLFDSSTRYVGTTYPYLNQLPDITGKSKLEEESYVNVLTSSKSDFIIASILPEAELTAANRGLRNTLVFVTAGCVVAAIAFTLGALRNVSRRTQTIVRAMKRLQKGDLSVRIPIREEDEISLISSRFNQMCEDLEHYINRVYRSEVKKKQAELVALQAQIKPHFLYNTLEAIRMRALAQSARDVGNMISILSQLLKYSIKYDTIVTLADEMNYCQQYLELFRIRHKNKFAYTFTMDPEISHVSVIKCSLQPLIENYIMHGIRLDREDNQIDIVAKARSGAVYISIQDNGRGISETNLMELRRRLMLEEPEDLSSIGLRNVNERLKLIYGDDCTLQIENQQGGGAQITMILPTTERGDLEHVPSVYRG